MDKKGEKSRARTAFDRIFRLSRIVGVNPNNSDMSVSSATIASSIIKHLIQFLLVCGTSAKMIVINRNNPTKRLLVISELWALLLLNVFSTVWLAIKGSTIKCIRQELELYLRTNTIDWNWSPSLIATYRNIVPTVLIMVYICVIKYGTITVYSLQFSVTIVTCYFMLNATMNQFLGLQSLLRSLIAEVRKEGFDGDLLSCEIVVLSFCDALNECYGPINFSIVSSMFIRLLCHLYIQLGIIFDQGAVVWFYIGVYPIINIVTSTRKTIKELEKLNQVIYNRSLEQPDDETLNFYLTARREFTFSASGFFNLDNSLICSMIGAGTTYLVILLQYSVPSGIYKNQQQGHFNETS